MKHPREVEIQAIRKLMRSVDPRVREEVKWNAPSYATSEHFATFNLRAKHGVQVVLHLGARPHPKATLRAEVADPTGLLEWKTPDRAIVTFQDPAHLDRERQAFVRLVRQWIEYVGEV